MVAGATCRCRTADVVSPVSFGVRQRDVGGVLRLLRLRLLRLPIPTPPARLACCRVWRVDILLQFYRSSHNWCKYFCVYHHRFWLSSALSEPLEKSFDRRDSRDRASFDLPE